MKLKQLKYKDVAPLREKLLKEQSNKCAICGCVIDEKSGSSLDHQHKLKSEPCGKDGGGLIRGVLCRNCNVWEGKIWNGTRRYRQPQNVNERVQMLKELIKFYEKEPLPLIHPTETPPTPKLMKSSYNKLLKLYKGKAKFPNYPKSKKITKKLEKLYIKHNLEPEFYK